MVRPALTVTEKKTKRYSSATTGYALVVTSHILNHMYDSLLPILYPPMISEFGLSYSLVGMLVMGYRMSSGALQLVMGFLGRFVRRKILLGFGMIWQSIVNCFISISRSFEHVLLNRTLAGVGASPQHPTGSSYIAESFSKDKIGGALGMSAAAGHIGMFVTPIMGSLLLSTIGWRATILAFSIPGIAIGIAFLFIQESKASQRWSGTASLSLLLRGVRDVLSDRTVLAVLVLETVMAFRAGAGNFLPSYMVLELGLPSIEVGVLFAIFLGAGIPAPYVWGHLSDKFHRRKVVMLTMSMAAILWYVLPYGSGSLQLLMILATLGFACQGVGGVIQAIVADKTIIENRDITYGIYFTIASTIGSLSPVILGYLADSFSFQASFTYVALVSLSAVIASYFLK